MKGLLLKDGYAVVKYCRAYLLVLFVFLAVSCYGNMFFVFYPVLFAGMIPVTLIAYDEREKWHVYCDTLPCSRAQFVSAKYLTGLLLEVAAFLLSAATQAFRMHNSGSFDGREYLGLLVGIFCVGFIGPSFLMPFVFKFGAEKGRIAYYVVIALICAGGTILVSGGVPANAQPRAAGGLVIAVAIAVVLYALSWALSILFYKKRSL